MTDRVEREWLLLIHQIPPKPDYFRVKIWRRLQRVGAVAIKQSVYVLPKSEQTQEDLNWILREITEGGGEAYICEVHFLEGISNEKIVDMFQAARGTDYSKIIEDTRSLAENLSRGYPDEKEGISKARTRFSRLRRRFEEVAAIDFFTAPERGAAEGALANLTSRILVSDRPPKALLTSTQNMEGRTWITRKGIFVDRIACAWLIRRFIDHGAEFKFVSGQKYRPKPDELRFDMFEAEFTHQGDKCTFEVMVDRFCLDDPALIPIGEIIHDIDLKDQKFGRQEAPGISTLFSGIAMAYDQDEKRLERGLAILDEMHEYFSRRSKGKVM